MKRSTDRILTTHVGSLIRPKALLDSAKDHAAHEAALKQAVTDIVARQAQAGVDIVNDGEFGKSGWANYALDHRSLNCSAFCGTSLIRISTPNPSALLISASVLQV